MGNEIEEYYYKKNKTKGNVYMQIWQRAKPKDIMICSLGTASKLVSKLKAGNLIQTKPEERPTFQENPHTEKTDLDQKHIMTEKA